MKNIKLILSITANIIVVIFFKFLLNTQNCFATKMEARCDVNSSAKATNEFMSTLFAECFNRSLYNVVIILNQSSFEFSSWQQRISEAHFLFDYEAVMNTRIYTFAEKHMFTSKNASQYSSRKIMLLEEIESVKIQPFFQKFKDTHFWNSHSIYFVKITNTYGSCRLAADLFSIIWSFNVMNAYFICHHFEHGNVLYTFNPYSSHAPEPWIRVETVLQQNEHPFTIFMNDGKKDIFNSMHWEKARKLSHYPVKVANITFSRYVEDAEDGREESVKTIYQINDIIWSKLEADIISEKFSWEKIGLIDCASGEATSVTSSVLRGEYECLVAEDFERGLWRNEVNLFTITGGCFVTQKKLASILQQMSKAFPMYTWLSFLLLFLSTTVLLTYLLKINYQDVAIDVLRMTVGGAMISPAKTNLSKVIVVYLLLIFSVINTYLQGKLEMLLTIEPSHSSLENLTELVENGYKVYTTSYYWQYYSAQPFYRKNIMIDESLDSCLKLTKHDNKIVCVNDCYDIEKRTRERKDLVSHKDIIVYKYNIQLFRDDSVLKDQFEKVYAKLHESGIPDFWYEITNSDYRRPRHSHFQAISMYQLRFTFDFLLILLAISGAIFLFEIFEKY